MRKINLLDYEIQTPAGVKNYQVKDSIVLLLFNADLKLDAVQLLKTNELALKISSAESELLLEESEYSILANAINRFKGYTQNEVELVKRILNAEQVEVQEVK